MTSEATIWGQWALRRVGGGPPEGLHIKAMSLTIDREGRWFTEASMGGPFEGMIVKAEGEWRLEGTLLHYSAGELRGTTPFRLSETVLSFRTDFALAGKDGQSVSSEYIR